MDSFRSVLETLKFLAPEDVLKHTSQVGLLWSRTSNSDELWFEFLAAAHIPLNANPKEVFRLTPFCTLTLLTEQTATIRNCLKDVERVVRLVEPVRASWNSAHALIDTTTIILCGNQTSSISAESCIIDLAKGSVRAIDPMFEARVGHGVIVTHPYAYVFGGYGPLASSEKCDLNTGKWLQLPHMLAEHAWFTPCRDHQSIFICGGNTNVCEQFNLVSQEFSLLPITLLANSGSTCTVHHNGYLIILHAKTATAYNIETRASSDAQLATMGDVWSNSPAIVVGKTVLSERDETGRLQTYSFTELTETHPMFADIFA